MRQILVEESENYISSKKYEELIIKNKELTNELSTLIRSLEK